MRVVSGKWPGLAAGDRPGLQHQVVDVLRGGYLIRRDAPCLKKVATLPRLCQHPISKLRHGR